MELQTERLRMIPCTKETVKIAEDQSYENGTHISNYLKQLNKDPALVYWGSWLVLRNQMEWSLEISVLKGNQIKIGQLKLAMVFLKNIGTRGMQPKP